MKILFQAAGVSILALVLANPAVHAKTDSLVISVFSKANDSYKREFLPDGSVKPQTYVVGDGGINGRSTAGGGNVTLTFPNVVRLLAHRLVQQNYYPAGNSKSADLLLVVSLGETDPFNDSSQSNANAHFSSAMNHLQAAENDVKLSESHGEAQFTFDGIQSPKRTLRDDAREEADNQMYQMLMFEDIRMKADEENARLLGYVEEINRRNNPSRFGGAGNYFNDLISDLESGRYYVIVQAYDYQAAVKDGQRRLVWTTRISIPVSGNNFNTCLPAMLADASSYFGRSSGRLVRSYREGVVRLGELEILGVVPPSEMGHRPSADEGK